MKDLENIHAHAIDFKDVVEKIETSVENGLSENIF